MREVRIALVIQEPDLRYRVAEAFDHSPAHWRVALLPDPPKDADVVVSDHPGHDVLVTADAAGNVVEQVRSYLGRARTGKVIAVTGSSGGCGVTSIALHLGAAFARSSTAVVVENDPRSRGLAYRLGMDDAARTWMEAGDDRSLELSCLPVSSGARVLLAPAEGEAPDDLAARVAGIADLVVTEPRIVPAATAGVLVLRATIPAARRAARIIPALPDIPWAVVLNHPSPADDLPAKRVAEIIGVPVVLELPFTSALGRAERSGDLLTSAWSSWRSRIQKLAGALSAS